jgi:hypothetical protein
MGRPPIGKVAMTTAERVRRHRLKHRTESRAAKAERPLAEVTALKAELAEAKAYIEEIETVALLSDPDILAEVNDAIKSMKRATMDFATQSAIVKVLHPDQRNNATDADKNDALKRFTSWKADVRKAEKIKNGGG